MPRVDGVLYTERRARKQHTCELRCGYPIEPGETYAVAALPPHVDPNSMPHWWTMKIHGRSGDSCPAYNPGLPEDPIAADLAMRLP